MIVEKYRITVRYNEQIKKRIDELISKYPGDFRTSAQIFRAGVMALHRERIGKEVDTNGLL